MRRPQQLWFLVALVPYFLLATTTVREVGAVGEVSPGWRAGPPINFRIDISTPPPESVLGPLHARQTRPIERLVLGPLELPLAINSYTGAMVDWPARVVHAITGRWSVVQAFHLLLGAGLLAGLFTFVRRHVGTSAAVAAALVLATRWDFVFYRAVLGGTEVALVGATLAVVWALWSRRWRGNPHGLVAIALGVGIGMHAKLTFGVVAVAIALSATLLRRDRPPMGPPAGGSKKWALVALAVPLLPLVVANLHQPRVPGPRIHSHDHVHLQLDRVLGALQGSKAPTRESLGNIVAWLGDPLGFLGRAYGVADVPDAPWALVGLGWLVVGAGVFTVWRRRHPTPRDALLRFGSVLLPIGVFGLLVVARDLHHMATLSIVVALVAGLAADQVAGWRYPLRSWRRVLAAIVFVSPWVVTGTSQLVQTDPLVRQIPVPTFRTDGQHALAALVAPVPRVWVSDYESMGALELRLAELGATTEVIHVWGAASRRATGLDSFHTQLLQAAVGDHLLVVEASAPMIYNLRSRGRALERAATEAGVRLVEEGRLDRDEAVLYRVEAQ